MVKPDVTNQKSLASWLANQPAEVGYCIASRAALRILPMSASFGNAPKRFAKSRSAVILERFHFASMAWGCARYPEHIKSILGSYSDAHYDEIVSAYQNANSETATPDAYLRASFFSAVDSRQETVGYAAAAAYAASRIEPHVGGNIYAETDRDITDFIVLNNIAPILSRPLWPVVFPKWISREMMDLRNLLGSLDENWDVWTRWYDALLEGRPTPGGEELDLFRVRLNGEEDWEKGAISPGHVNRLIKAREEEIEGRTAKMSAPLPTPDAMVPVEPQNDLAIVFGGDDDAPVDVLSRVGADRVSRSQDSRDSHSETVRFAHDLIALHEGAAISPNNGNALAYADTKLLLEALGNTLDDLRPGLLIPRGEALRQLLARHEARDDLSDAPPLTDNMRDALAKLVRCYNGFVSLDAELARRDEAQLGPDAIRKLVPPEEGKKVALDAADQNAATQAAADAVASESKNAPRVPDANNRNSRRASETVKNLARSLLARAWKFIKITFNVASGLSTAASVAAGLWGAAAFVVKKAAQLESWFAGSPQMLEIIKSIVATLKQLPFLD